MVRLLTASHGNQPTKYSMSDNDAIANSKRKRKKSDGEGLSVIIFLCSHLSLYLYNDDEKKMNKSAYTRTLLLYKEDAIQ